MIRSFPGGRLLLVVLCLQGAFAIGIAAALGSGTDVSREAVVVLVSLAASLIVVTFFVALKGIRDNHAERSRARSAYALIETVAETSQEWLWAVDAEGTFLFSSRASKALLGYDPAELVGQPCQMVLDLEDLASARRSVAAAMDSHGSGWDGVVMVCRHRNGAPVWMEASGRARPAGTGFEGTSRPLPPQSARELLKQRITDQVEATLRGRVILTAFQPIYRLPDREIIGVEALARFPSEDGKGAEHWFNEANTVGLGGELEFVALEAALNAAGRLPAGLYVALNLSPQTCLDPRLPGLLEKAALREDRIVLELTENLAVAEYAPLTAALAPLRRRGLRLAIDDAGSGYASMRHILQLRPDIIKLDRALIAGIDHDPARQALGAAMVDFAKQIGATIIAEGIENPEELAAVTALGMNAGQGYFLGRPTIRPADWQAWRHVPRNDSDETAHTR
ncbi:sensor domain-containing phosphodiesterase [Arthrobacter terricola]|nr:EAL domain-containing protein [Arthrobacter terricola]